MLYAAPGATFEATFAGAPAGLVGTFGVQVRDGDDVVLARSTAGIVEALAGSGDYVATLVAPDVAGQYVVLGDTGGGAPVYAAEDLVVTYSLGAAAVPQDGDLTTLAAVRSYLQKEDAETAQDDVLQAVITRASRAIMSYTRREFAPAGALDEARAFTYWGGSMLRLAPYDLRSATSVVFDSQGDSPTTLTVVDDYTLQPANGPVYRWLWLGSSVCRWRQRFLAPRTVTITGLWGWPSVPEDVEQACVVTAALWMRRDVQAFAATFNMSEDRLERPEALPSAVKGMLRPYRGRAVA